MDISNDKNPKCFKVDYNNNQIEVSYGNETATSIFPVIIDNDVDQDGNVIINYLSDNDDFDEITDELNRNRYLKRNIVEPIPKKKDVEDDDDVMFQSLRRLSTAYDALNTNQNKQVRFSIANNRKMSTIPFQPNISKNLTFIINEIYFTNGKTSLELVQRTNNLQTKFFVRKKLFTKRVRCVGTSLKNCVQSDVISIDIEEASTLLPMMCKLMIIVEGAGIERGKAVLVRDFAIQVNCNSNGVFEEDSYDQKRKQQQQKANRYSTDTDDDDDDDETNEESEDTYNQNFINESKSQYCKLTRINNKNKSSKMKKRKEKVANISGRRDSYYRRQSYFNLNEYSSVPYYQYMKNFSKNSNAESMTEDYYLTANNNIMIINSSNKEQSVNIPIERVGLEVDEEDEEEIEISIPINIEKNNSEYDRMMRVNQGVYRYKPNGGRRRTVYEETYNKFEAEVTRFNSNRFFKYSSNSHPVVYTFYNYGSNDNTTNSSEGEVASVGKNPILKIEDSRSVTQVFLGQLVDGNLKQ
jgi:hypothetical protein